MMYLYKKDGGITLEHKIVMDSAGDIKAMDGVDFVSVPLKILAGEQEFVDDEALDVEGMTSYLKTYKGKSSTACPNVGEYLEAFGDAENVYCITITSNLSGSYNAAAIAAETYREQHPDRNVFVFDSLSTGPEMVLLAQKIRQWLGEKLPFQQIVEQGKEYLNNVKLVFSLESLNNLANNGRVPGAVAKLAGILSIRLIAKASDVGTIQPTGKARGEKKVAPELMKHLADMGYNGGRVLIHHCMNSTAAETLRKLILEKYPRAEVAVGKLGGLCSFYAEQGGLLVGFETA